MRNEIILIPTLNPNQRLTELIEELNAAGFFKIIVVDDGSEKKYRSFFSIYEEKKCIVEHHRINLGKGAAIKTGILSSIRNFGRGYGIITVDSDGQHLVKDIKKVADAMEKNPNELILGTRNFDEEKVPWKSRMGNKITAAFFRASSGVRCDDTQTGLRGIPPRLLDLALEESGMRYEYEMEFLSDAVQQVPLHMIPITTVYENDNRGSHFRPVQDSLRIYKRPLRFLGASVAGAASDFLLFFIISQVVFMPHVQAVFAATIMARFGSGIVNFQLNRHISFQSNEPVGKEAARYFTLFITQMLLSAAGVSVLSLMLPLILSKVIIDVGLFFFSYVIQKRWVFKKGDKTDDTQKKKEPAFMGNHI